MDSLHHSGLLELKGMFDPLLMSYTQGGSNFHIILVRWLSSLYWTIFLKHSGWWNYHLTVQSDFPQNFNFFIKLFLKRQWRSALLCLTHVGLILLKNKAFGIFAESTNNIFITLTYLKIASIPPNTLLFMLINSTLNSLWKFIVHVMLFFLNQGPHSHIPGKKIIFSSKKYPPSMPLFRKFTLGFYHKSIV